MWTTARQVQIYLHKLYDDDTSTTFVLSVPFHGPWRPKEKNCNRNNQYIPNENNFVLPFRDQINHWNRNIKHTWKSPAEVSLVIVFTIFKRSPSTRNNYFLQVHKKNQQAITISYRPPTPCEQTKSKTLPSPLGPHTGPPPSPWHMPIKGQISLDHRPSPLPDMFKQRPPPPHTCSTLTSLYKTRLCLHQTCSVWAHRGKKIF